MTEEASLTASELKALIKESVTEIEADRKAAEEAARQAEEAAQQAAASATAEAQPSGEPGDASGDAGESSPATQHIDVAQALPSSPPQTETYRHHGRVRIRRTESASDATS